MQSGGLQQLLDLLESKQINLQHNAAFALYGLSDNEDNIPCIIQAGGLQRLYDCSERLQVQASKVSGEVTWRVLVGSLQTKAWLLTACQLRCLAVRVVAALLKCAERAAFGFARQFAGGWCLVACMMSCFWLRCTGCNQDCAEFCHHLVLAACTYNTSVCRTV
jgi:hypothetical protein